MTNIFVYGTLLNTEVLQLLINEPLSLQKAELINYKRVTVLGEVFPAIFPEKNSKVDGAVIMGLNDSNIDLLDEYEDILYDRKSVTVALTNKHQVLCETYIVKPEYRHLLSDQAWSNDKFREQHLEKFVSKLTEYYQ